MTSDAPETPRQLVVEPLQYELVIAERRTPLARTTPSYAPKPPMIGHKTSMNRSAASRSNLSSVICWLSVFAVTLLQCAHADAKPEQLRVAEIQSPEFPIVQTLEHFSRLVGQRTDNRLAVRVLHSGILGDEYETVKQTKIGGIDLNRLNTIELGIPKFDLLSIPFLFNSDEHLARVIYGPIGDELLEALHPVGLIGLTFLDNGPRSIYTRAPLTGMSALAGMRLRIQRSGLMERMIEAFSARPMVLPYKGIYVALSTQLIDGAENTMSSFFRGRHYEIARHFSVTKHTYTPSVLVMSRRAWDRLRPDDQTILRAAARDAALRHRTVQRDADQQARNTLVENGVVFNERLDLSPFVAATSDLRSNKTFFDTSEQSLISRIEALK
jgi:tripartite ATP-independent transporter DctP family solute receptor